MLRPCGFIRCPCCFEFFDTEVRRLGRAEDNRLIRDNGPHGPFHFGDDLGRNVKRSMTADVNQFFRLHMHSHDVNGNFCFNDMDEAMADADGTGQERETRINGVEITHHAAGHRIQHSQTLVDRYANLSQPGTDGVWKVHVLNHRDGGMMSRTPFVSRGGLSRCVATGGAYRARAGFPSRSGYAAGSTEARPVRRNPRSQPRNVSGL